MENTLLLDQITHKNVHNRFKLNGYHLNYEDLCRVVYSFIKEGEDYEKHIGSFLLEWLDDNSYIEVETSGTTGVPKIIRLEKRAMIQSALATGDFFNLDPGDTALLCLSAKYIAGKMMLVRALILGLELDITTVDGNPLLNNDKVYDFAAMVPLQVENSLEKLRHIKKIIIGGAPVSKALAEKLKKKKINAFETYGMTETITHVAARKIGTETFKTLPNISISKDDRDCLVIQAPKILADPIVTNDIVTLVNEKEFIWLGRFDSVINSGGIKLFPEQIEIKLQSFIKERFFIASESDEKLGQKVILVIESKEKSIPDTVFDNLNKFEKPKAIYFIPKFVTTETGKLNRIETLKMIKQN
ncbi:O-succinylbenzoic acid--CoA ligase [Flavobacterium sp. 9AF]|uniref:AMP-binding protein n=1 Tax=Flavobacterium sp. 9AF TaxID=2653142 RepID=UPI0012F30A9B|nr:AMP-binding protein [Flavobacterium sp. 9AF]VXB99906.1 O-succinylbenzoic acid--CoA ligase [Flavobacterium sp. 9AF]